MHTGPFSMRLDPDCSPFDNDNEPRATYWPADEVVACPDFPGSDDLTDRERYEIACWTARLDGDPSADRCAS